MSELQIHIDRMMHQSRHVVCLTTECCARPVPCNSPVMSALLPMFMAVPIALMVLFEIELLDKFKALTEPDENGNVRCIGRAMELYVSSRATRQVEHIIGSTDHSEASKAEHDERLAVLASVKKFTRKRASRPDLHGPHLHVGGAGPEVAYASEAMEGSSNAGVTARGDLQVADVQARQHNISVDVAATMQAQVELVS